MASNITEGLVARGWDVTLFASRDSVTRARLHAVVDKGYEEDPAVERMARAFGESGVSAIVNGLGVKEEKK